MYLDSNWGGGVIDNLRYRPEILALDACIGTTGMTSLVRDLLWPGPIAQVKPDKRTFSKMETGKMDVARRLALINEADTDGNTALL